MLLQHILGINVCYYFMYYKLYGIYNFFEIYFKGKFSCS